MMNLKEVSEKKEQAERRYEKRRAAIEKQIEELRAKEKRMKYPQISTYFNPLMEQVRKILKAQKFEWLGPFGLNSEWGCHFIDMRRKTEEHYSECIASLSFVSRYSGYHLRTRKIVNTYPKGTIAEMNGDNYEVLEPTEKMDAKYLAKMAVRE